MFCGFCRPGWFWMADRDLALRACFVSVALWWFVFALPLFFKVPEPGSRERALPPRHVVTNGFVRLAATLRQIRRYRQLALFLAAFWIYNDGISTIIKLAAAYGDEIGMITTTC